MLPDDYLADLGNNATYLWKSFDVVGADTGRLLWTVEAEDGGIVPYDTRVWGRAGALDEAIWGSRPDSYIYFAYRGRPASFFDSVHDRVGSAWSAWNAGHQTSGLTAWILELETGVKRPLTHAEWLARQDRRVQEACYSAADRPVCVLSFQGSLVWEGDPHFIGLSRPTGPIVLRNPELPSPAAPGIGPPDPPSRQEMIGPLLIYLLWGAESDRDEDGEVQLFVHADVMIHDDGSGRGWRSLSQRIALPGAPLRSVWPARGGFVTHHARTVSYVAADGQVEAVLVSDIPEREAVSEVMVTPDGEQVAIVMRRDEAPEGYIDGGQALWPASYTLLVFDLVSRDLVMREEFEELGPVAHISNWSEDGLAFTVELGGYDGQHLAGVVYLDRGVFTRPPEGVDQSYYLSPDLRHAVRTSPAAEIIEYESGQVVRPLDPLGRRLSAWRWIAVDQFAWSSEESPGQFNLWTNRVERGIRADVAVLTVSTGEIETMDSDEYLERFAPGADSSGSTAPDRARVECPEDSALTCQVLLDGEILGEGRVAQVVGFVALD